MMLNVWKVLNEVNPSKSEEIHTGRTDILAMGFIIHQKHRSSQNRQFI